MRNADKMTARQGLRPPVWLATLGCAGVLLFNVFTVAEAAKKYDTNHKLLDGGVEVVGRVIAVESHDDWTRNRVKVDYIAADHGYDRWIGAREPGDDLPLVDDSISLLYEPGYPTTVALEDLVTTGGYRSALVLSGIALLPDNGGSSPRGRRGKAADDHPPLEVGHAAPRDGRPGCGDRRDCPRILAGRPGRRRAIRLVPTARRPRAFRFI
jgi:hypothetical protein